MFYEQCLKSFDINGNKEMDLYDFTLFDGISGFGTTITSATMHTLGTHFSRNAVFIIYVVIIVLLAVVLNYTLRRCDARKYTYSIKHFIYSSISLSRHSQINFKLINKIKLIKNLNMFYIKRSLLISLMHIIHLLD